ncbi:MAG: hypothetical protein V9H25_12555 [Candidatus Competibacter sp.]
MQRDKAEPVQIECPRCRYTSIIYIPYRRDAALPQVRRSHDHPRTAG